MRIWLVCHGCARAAPAVDPLEGIPECRCGSPGRWLTHRQDTRDAFAYRVIACERRLMGEDITPGGPEPGAPPPPPSFLTLRRVAKGIRRRWRALER